MNTAYPLKQSNVGINIIVTLICAIGLHITLALAVFFLAKRQEVPAVIEPPVLMTQLIAAPAPEPMAAPEITPEPPPPLPEPPKPKPKPKPKSKPKPKKEKVFIPAEPEPTLEPVEEPASEQLESATEEKTTTASASNLSGSDERSGTPDPTPGPPIIERAASNLNASHNNPTIVYPRLSNRMREEGRVILRVLIGSNGRAKDVEVHSSSGYHRLDEAARKAAFTWNYTPSKRDGVPFDDWYDIPVDFHLT